MKPFDTVFTMMLFRGPTAKPIRLRLPRPFFQVALILAAGVMLAELVLILQFATHMQEIGEVHSLQSEISNTRVQKAALLDELAEIKRQVLAIKHVNWRFSVMLGQEEAQSHDMINGKGGEESGVLSFNLGLRSGNQSLSLEQELQWLKAEASSQENWLRRNILLAEEKSVRWASTPSIWPVKGAITSGFGPRTSPFSGEPAQHNGVDIGASTNTPVVAPANGKVVAVKDDPNMGIVVKIDHRFDLQTEYRHLAKALVREGQTLKRGEVIGLVGNTGLLSTGPHLHYQVLINDRPVNPQEYFFD